jgi:hypothetical protein
VLESFIVILCKTGFIEGEEHEEEKGLAVVDIFGSVLVQEELPYAVYFFKEVGILNS